jgi:hypothetical protein
MITNIGHILEFQISFCWLAFTFKISKFFTIFKLLCTCELCNNEATHITYYVILQSTKTYCSSKLYDMKTWTSIKWSSSGQNLHSTSQAQTHSSYNWRFNWCSNQNFQPKILLLTFWQGKWTISTTFSLKWWRPRTVGNGY